MRVLDLFSGIGGFSLGLERAGMATAMFCEIEPFCRRVLAKHWPGVPIHDDVRTLDRLVVAEKAGAVDLVCGGFPCQDISVAGKGAGLDGERSGLWFEYRRIIEEVAPRWVVIENVPALRSRGLDTVLGGLAALGYDVEWHCIPASALGAPHRRDRVWLVAHARRGGVRPHGVLGEERGSTSSLESEGHQRERVRDAASGGGADANVAHTAWNVRAWAETSGAERERAWPGGAGGGTRDVAHAAQLLGHGGDFYAGSGSQSAAIVSEFGDGGAAAAVANAGFAHVERQRGLAERISAEIRDLGDGGGWGAEPDVGRVAYGVPSRVDRLRSLGNAVVPQVVEVIGRAIMAAETGRGE